ncbi:DUF3392 domain-containing protein [Thalassotalea sp. 1_MG-2023]|uniref:DUF3392 domain-containing protein n=1 Tax=Thalassotalea sp. 1_MG-2023 TaxID=3062680 RepID=UPI0026E1777A|nr:DUF3392 domain-containing protein [Thalassotalea sp. 1_MG-2023]MDO6427728.1 DUF3392 domain-containing protein [Thalassotalea sp. 1_MG-2023]
MIELLTSLGQWFRPYQYQTALAIIATILVLFGNDINGALKHMIRKQHFVVRTLVFIVVCAFGYGLLTVWLTALLAKQLSSIPTVYIVPSVVLIFVVLGIYAQKQRHI